MTLAEIFNGLAAGGRTKMPISDQSLIGWLTDKFGINWMVSIDKAVASCR